MLATELTELKGTFGSLTRLTLKPLRGTRLLDNFNDYVSETLPNEPGAECCTLADLVPEFPVEALFRLNAPALATAAELLQVKLDWVSPLT